MTRVSPSLLQYQNDTGEWHRHRLAGVPVQVSLQAASDGLLELTPTTGVNAPAALALVYQSPSRRNSQAVHLSISSHVYRNAESQPLGFLAVLRDHDCLTYHIEGQAYRLFFDAFTPPVVQPYSGPEVECAFCREALVGGSAVRCPGCRIWFHQDNGVECWEAQADGCSSCGHPTALDRAPSWLPDGFSGGDS